MCRVHIFLHEIEKNKIDWADVKRRGSSKTAQELAINENKSCQFFWLALSACKAGVHFKKSQAFFLFKQ